MNNQLRWAYAMNQWNIRMDIFVRHEHHQRALKTVSALGFDFIELASGMGGRWDNMGRPEAILSNHGTTRGFADFLGQASIRGVSSHFWDPGLPAEEDGYAFLMSTNPSDEDAIVAAAQPLIEFAGSMGTEVLVVRPCPSAWMVGLLDAETIERVGALWNRVAALAAPHGLKIAMHVDALCAIHTEAQIETLLAATDPDQVGLALDTAEFVIAGIDPIAFYTRHAERVNHIHLKNTQFCDSGEEFLTPNAEMNMMRGGSGREIERWFVDLGSEAGLVDVAGFIEALEKHDYQGWVVVESDQSGNPAEMVMLNSWFLYKHLGVKTR